MSRDFKDNEMTKPITGKEFRDSGMLWFVNTILHTFGMAITWDSKTDKIEPALVKFRGFAEENNDAGYKKVTQYMIDNASELMKDCD